MRNTGKIVISLVITLIAATATAFLVSDTLFHPVIFLTFLAATLATAFLVSMPEKLVIDPKPRADGKRSHNRPGSERKPGAESKHSGGQRDEGNVKWFNMAKGFGFIRRDNGEEIFVHFRSIRGEGRRGLRDGQRVSFVVTQSEKGPQAEDVEAISQ